MLKWKVYFDEAGVLHEMESPNLVQGDDKTTLLTVLFKDASGTFVDFDTNNYVVECMFKRNDGEISPTLIMNTNATEANLILSNWITAVVGDLKVTIWVRECNVDSATTGEYAGTKATGSITVTVHEGIIPANTTISNAEKEAIAAKFKDIDDELTYNNVGLLDVSAYNEETGEITYIYDSSLIREIDDSQLEETGEITIYANPINWEEGAE